MSTHRNPAHSMSVLNVKLIIKCPSNSRQKYKETIHCDGFSVYQGWMLWPACTIMYS